MEVTFLNQHFFPDKTALTIELRIIHKILCFKLCSH